MTRNIALVLSSGGARGIAHIGVIEELTDAGFSITSVAGTSMGSLVGGMLAKGSLPEYTNWLLHFTRMDVLRFLDLTIGSGGLVKGEKILKALEDFIGEVNIEDMPIPYACVASDLIGHQEVVFNKGSLLKAIRASISIPTVFKPVLTDGMLLVDGGVLNPLPLDIVHRSGNDLLVAVNVNSPIDYEAPRKEKVLDEHEKHYGKVRAALNERWSEVIEHYNEKYRHDKLPKAKQINMFDIISDSIKLSQDKLAKINIEKYKPDMVIDISYKVASAFDFYKTEELIEAGKVACRNELQNWRNSHT